MLVKGPDHGAETTPSRGIHGGGEGLSSHPSHIPREGSLISMGLLLAPNVLSCKGTSGHSPKTN